MINPASLATAVPSGLPYVEYVNVGDIYARLPPQPRKHQINVPKGPFHEDTYEVKDSNLQLMVLLGACLKHGLADGMKRWEETEEGDFEAQQLLMSSSWIFRFSTQGGYNYIIAPLGWSKFKHPYSKYWVLYRDELNHDGTHAYTKIKQTHLPALLRLVSGMCSKPEEWGDHEANGHDVHVLRLLAQALM